MTCQQFEADLVDLARGALVDDSTEPSVRRHLEACAACAVRFEHERELTAGLRALAAATAVPANDIAERRLMEAFAATRGIPSPAGRRWPVVRWAAMAAAACVLFFLGTWAAVAWHSYALAPPGAAAPVQAAASPSSEQPSRAEPAANPDLVPEPFVASIGPAPPTRTRPAALRHEPSRDTDRLEGFIALPAADGLPGFDSGMIVRVSLPTASLPAFGLAIAPEATQTVNADLLVGQDGQARAIRLVSLAGGPRREPR